MAKFKDVFLRESVFFFICFFVDVTFPKNRTTSQGESDITKGEIEMKLLKRQKTLQPQYGEYAEFLRNYEEYSEAKSKLFAMQIQDFTQSGMTPKDYFEEIDKSDKRGAETFLYNFENFVQFQTNQFFEDLLHTRWERMEATRKALKGEN